jgi:hypothetical protein
VSKVQRGMVQKKWTLLKCTFLGFKLNR